MSVLFGYPVGGSELPIFAASVRRLQRYEGMKETGPLLAGIVCETSIYVDDNRNRLVEYLLKAPPAVEWLLQVDTDIEFKKDVLERMLVLAESRGFKILGASVPIGETHETSAFLFDDVPGRFRTVTKLPPEPVRVAAIATTCALIHRSVFEDMAKQFGRCWFTRISIPSPDNAPNAPMELQLQDTLGEDMSFCCRAKAMGLDIWCAYIPGLRHWKLVGFTHDDAAMWPRREKKTERPAVTESALVAEG